MEMGMTESTMLLWSVVLGLVQIVIASMAVNKDVGLPYNLSSRDEPAPPLSKMAGRLVRAYGTEAAVMLEGARAAGDLGERFGWDLTEREVRWLAEREWARTAEDVLWRRSKLGLRFTPEEAAAGFERLEAAVAADPDALVPSYRQPLLTLTRP